MTALIDLRVHAFRNVLPKKGERQFIQKPVEKEEMLVRINTLIWDLDKYRPENK